MNKKDIIIINRNASFYSDDLEMIENKEEGWDLKILHDLVSFIDGKSELYEMQGVIICENTKTGKIEVLKYE